MTTMIHRTPLATAAVMVAVVVMLSSPFPASGFSLFPDVEITLANDGLYPIWFMCQMTDKSDSLYELSPNVTYRFTLKQAAFPMRWCYLYISQTSQGFFWAFTVRSKCTKCFWSISKYPSLYRGDKGRWERQKLFMPPDFDISDYRNNGTNSSGKTSPLGAPA
ncbi:hypothetical protein CASFOL_042320 [Castilleja foliolosa]|uniref:S-protein homolog n=1 Tax=Castilleja foliolosa TaxID=1961234 RepID=A0ABD3BAW9_9LAMI